MNIRFLILGIIALFISQTAILKAQSDTPLDPAQEGGAIYLGPVIGYNMSMHSVDLASFAEDPLCPYFENGSSNGFHIGVFYEQVIGGVLSQHSVVGRLLYNSMPAYFEKVGDTYPSLVDDGQGGYTTVMSSTKHTVDVVYSMVSLNLMYKFRVIGGFVLTIGPDIDFILSNSLTQKYMITDPDNVAFKPVDPDPATGYPKYEDNNRTIVVYDGDIGEGEGSASTRFGLKLGAQYEIRSGKKMTFIPGFFYNMGLTNATTNEDWKVSALQFSLDLRFAL